MTLTISAPRKMLFSGIKQILQIFDNISTYVFYQNSDTLPIYREKLKNSKLEIRTKSPIDLVTQKSASCYPLLPVVTRCYALLPIS